VKYGLAKPGQPGYGDVGPKTRAKLKELSVSGAPTVPAPADTSKAPSTDSSKADVDALNKQIDDAIKQVQELLKKT
jgi:hypothetical protein